MISAADFGKVYGSNKETINSLIKSRTPESKNSCLERINRRMDEDAGLIDKYLVGCADLFKETRELNCLVLSLPGNSLSCQNQENQKQIIFQKGVMLIIGLRGFLLTKAHENRVYRQEASILLMTLLNCNGLGNNFGWPEIKTEILDKANYLEETIKNFNGEEVEKAILDLEDLKQVLIV